MTNERKIRHNIELQSEEVQDIMGRMPPWILRWGITIIAFVLLTMIAGACFFRYPKALTGHIVILRHPNAKPTIVAGYATMPPTGLGKIRIGQKAKVKTDIYPDGEYGYIMGKVATIDTKPDHNGNYHIEIAFPDGLVTTYGTRLPQ